uniref:Uncharacterized protein n=1 Tax=Globisporangium ultimum (strain ATCC 200006 / CBS 805.95 / DAOM BR144) TaxID=431595 RepID=K3WPN4_GLOUD
MPQTPMSALGLPQSLPRVSALAQQERNAERRRRKRVVLGVVLVCSAVLLYELLQWTLGGFAAGAERKAVQRTANEQRKQRQHGEAQLVAEQVKEAKKKRESLGFRNEKQIVFLMTNYRDARACAQALTEAHVMAYLPSRIHFRVFDESYFGEDDTCVKVFCEQQSKLCREMIRSKQLRFAKRDASGALGATVSRHLVEGMVDKKQFQDHFYISADSSLSFTKHWDLELLKQWYSIGNDMAILSVAPKSLVLKDDAAASSSTLLQCSARIHSKSPDAVVEFNPPELKPKANALLFAPVLQSQYSELFHFGPVSALLAIRSDPHTPHITVGYEYARASRFWTSGYDFYAPTEDILYARYEWQPSPSLESSSTNEHNVDVEKSNRRIRLLLKLPVSSTAATEPLEEETRYALGAKRNMAQWEQFSRIDPKLPYNESTMNQFVVCNEQLKYVPFTF